MGEFERIRTGFELGVPPPHLASVGTSPQRSDLVGHEELQQGAESPRDGRALREDVRHLCFCTTACDTVTIISHIFVGHSVKRKCSRTREWSCTKLSRVVPQTFENANLKPFVQHFPATHRAVFLVFLSFQCLSFTSQTTEKIR